MILNSKKQTIFLRLLSDTKFNSWDWKQGYNVHTVTFLWAPTDTDKCAFMFTSLWYRGLMKEIKIVDRQRSAPTQTPRNDKFETIAWNENNRFGCWKKNRICVNAMMATSTAIWSNLAFFFSVCFCSFRSILFILETNMTACDKQKSHHHGPHRKNGIRTYEMHCQVNFLCFWWQKIWLNNASRMLLMDHTHIDYRNFKRYFLQMQQSSDQIIFQFVCFVG